MATTTLRAASEQLHPLPDSTNNSTIYDVIGNKADATTSTVGTVKSVIAYLKGLFGLNAVPTVDAVTNTNMRDVIGNKTDALTLVRGTTLSVISYLKGLIEKSDNILSQEEDTYNAVVTAETNLGVKSDDIRDELDVPIADSTDNLTIKDVIGNKTDSAITGADDLSSVMAYLKGTITFLEQLGYTAVNGSDYGQPVANSMGDYLKKIDGKAASGLTGTSNSLAYRVNEIERHFHSNERWFGTAYGAGLPTNAADRIGTTYDNPFQITSGNDTWGTWLQVLGSADTPAEVGNVYFDFHSIATTANSAAGAHFIQIGYGDTGTEAITNKTYSERVLVFDGINARQDFTIQGRRIPVGELVWARCWSVGQNAKTISFYLGIHEYEG